MLFFYYYTLLNHTKRRCAHTDIVYSCNTGTCFTISTYVCMYYTKQEFNFMKKKPEFNFTG
jgi:hypothetical protein